MKIAILIALFIAQAHSMSFYEDVIEPVKTLVSDVVTDLKYSIDCTILAVEQVFTLGRYGGESEYYRKCRGESTDYDDDETDDTSAADSDDFSSEAESTPDEQTTKYETDEKSSEEVKNTLSEEIQQSVSRTSQQIQNILTQNDAQRSMETVQNSIQDESNHIAEISNLIRHELQRLPDKVRKNFNLDLSDRQNIDVLIDEVKELFKLEQSDKSSATANEVRRIFDKVLNILHVDDDDGPLSDEDEVILVLKNLKQSSNESLIKKQVELWENEGIKESKNINNVLIINNEGSQPTSGNTYSAKDHKDENIIIADKLDEIETQQARLADFSVSLKGLAKIIYDKLSVTSSPMFDAVPETTVASPSDLNKNSDEVILVKKLAIPKSVSIKSRDKGGTEMLRDDAISVHDENQKISSTEYAKLKVSNLVTNETSQSNIKNSINELSTYKVLGGDLTDNPSTTVMSKSTSSIVSMIAPNLTESYQSASSKVHVETQQAKSDNYSESKKGLAKSFYEKVSATGSPSAVTLPETTVARPSELNKNADDVILLKTLATTKSVPIESQYNGGTGEMLRDGAISVQDETQKFFSSTGYAKITGSNLVTTESLLSSTEISINESSTYKVLGNPSTIVMSKSIASSISMIAQKLTKSYQSASSKVLIETQQAKSDDYSESKQGLAKSFYENVDENSSLSAVSVSETTVTPPNDVKKNADGLILLKTLATTKSVPIESQDNSGTDEMLRDGSISVHDENQKISSSSGYAKLTESNLVTTESSQSSTENSINESSTYKVLSGDLTDNSSTIIISKPTATSVSIVAQNLTKSDQSASSKVQIETEQTRLDDSSESRKGLSISKSIYDNVSAANLALAHTVPKTTIAAPRDLNKKSDESVFTETLRTTVSVSIESSANKMQSADHSEIPSTITFSKPTASVPMILKILTEPSNLQSNISTVQSSLSQTNTQTVFSAMHSPQSQVQQQQPNEETQASAETAPTPQTNLQSASSTTRIPDRSTKSSAVQYEDDYSDEESDEYSSKWDPAIIKKLFANNESEEQEAVDNAKSIVEQSKKSSDIVSSVFKNHAGASSVFDYY